MVENILLVEDSMECQRIVHRTLENSYRVSFASKVSEALCCIEHETFDLILIDIGLPDGDGFSLCKRLRAVERTEATPILFLTAKNELQDKVQGFSVGADDYIVKPFEPLELRARVESKLSRFKGLQKTDYSVRGDIEVHIPYQKAFINDVNGSKKVALELTPVEFKILYRLMRNQGAPLTREDLLKDVWGDNINVIDRTIDKHVSSLRRKLGDRSHYIESIYGVGYSFNASP